MKSPKEMYEELLQNITIVDDDTPEPEPCQTCNSLGFVQADVPFGHPAFGKRFLCPVKCAYSARYEQQVISARLTQSGLPEPQQRQTFGSWLDLPESIQAGKEDVFTILYVWSQSRQVSQDMLNGHAGDDAPAIPDGVWRGIWLTGWYGTGKTGLCSAAFVAAIRRTRGYYVRVQDLIGELKETWGQGGEQDIMQRYMTTPLLFLDDMNLQTGRTGGLQWWQLDYLERIMRHRNAAQLPTLITTNLSEDEFAAVWGERTSEATFELCLMLELEGARVRRGGES